MESEIEEQLKAFAKKRADDVFDIDIQTLEQLIIDGAHWMAEQKSDCGCCGCGGNCSC
jgi:hypothetical protein